MWSSNLVRRAVRAALLSSATISAMAVIPTNAAENKEKEPVTEVVVTGSRISTQGLDSPSPVQVIGAEDIQSSGVPNIQDLLLKSPVFGTPGVSRTNSNFATSGAGVATIDLRNLGASRTLVLVDGRRFVAGIPGTAAVDLNTIPAGFIERIDVLTGGASAVYGSDAVAGVVNIIYKKNFEGVAIDTQYGESAEGDDEQRQIGLTLGVNSADGKGNLTAYIGYTDQGAVFSRDRSRSAVDQLSMGLSTGDPRDFFTPIRPAFSSFAPQGRFFTENGPGAGLTIDGTTGAFRTFTGADGFNRSAQRTIAVPVERYLFAGRGNYEFAENQKVFFEGTYASTQSISELEPFPLDSANIYVDGLVPVESMVGGVLARNPLVPDAIFNTATDGNGDGLRDFSFTRRLSDVGNRGNTADRDTYRIVGGLQGTVFDKWNYEAFYAYGVTNESQVSGGQVNVLNFRNALEAVPDFDDIDNDGNTSEAVCRDATARSQMCAPINVFGNGSISADAARYVTAPGLLSTFTTQKVAGASVSGDLFNLPAGPLGIAVGTEYREEFSRSEFDALQQAGLNAGNAIPRTEGEFDVIEGYLELSVPLLADLPFVDSLVARGAVRVSDYSTVGSTTSYNGGLEYTPIPQVRFRAIRALSTRAPNIGELFSPASQNFPTGIVDPCVGVTSSSNGAADAACRADPGVAANIAANGSFTLTQADVQGVSGFDRGNPNLQEEESNSLTLGAVITPTGIPILEKFSFTVDYFDIDIDDAIVGIPRQFALDQCYTGDASFCQFVTRRDPNTTGANSPGAIQFLDQSTANSGGLQTEGIDFTVNFSQAIGPGDFVARLTYTHLIDGFTVPLPGAGKDEFKGEIGASEDRAFLVLGYNIGNFSVNWQTTYIGPADLDDQFLAGFDLAPGSVGIGSVTYNDLQLKYSPGTYEIFLGANNVFDKEPPPIISGLPGNTTGTETDAGTYDAIGRRIYGGLRMKF